MRVLARAPSRSHDLAARSGARCRAAGTEQTQFQPYCSTGIVAVAAAAGDGQIQQLKAAVKLLSNIFILL